MSHCLLYTVREAFCPNVGSRRREIYVILLVVEGEGRLLPTFGSRVGGKFNVQLLVVHGEGSLLSHCW